ncbi:MAG: hypothetical protein QGH40_15885 [bacterium]|nr:hypothetical protein [bacterium]
MHKAIPVLVAGMLLLSGFLTWASTSGAGVPKPVKKPISIREGSVRTAAAGTRRHRRSRYFGGGGHNYGK